MKKTPNIVFITCHDLGDYLGCYGTPVKTPNIDSIGAEGVVFENHMSTATICSPARGSILSGRYPHDNGLMGLIHRGWNLDVEKCKTMPQLFKDNGYDTNLFGFQHEHMDPIKLGYDHVGTTADHHCENVVPAFTNWLANYDSDKPFYAALGFTEVHRMGMNPSNFKYDSYEYADPAEVEVRPYLADIDATRNDLSEFYGAVEYMDKWVGKALEAIEDKGIRDNTLIVFTTDHGAAFMHSKATLYDGGTRVALVCSYKSELATGIRFKGMTSHVDILPTICDAIGLDCPAGVQGISQLSGIETGEYKRNYSISEENYNNHFVPGRAVRSQGYRYIKNGIPISIFDFLIPEIELSTSDFRKNLDVFNFYSAKRVTEELYDFSTDKGELVNLAEDEKYQDILNEHRAALEKHLSETNDPFATFKSDIHMPTHAYEMLREKKNNA